LLGNLFKNQRWTRSKTELYIVITPHIVRHRRPSEPAAPPPSADVPETGSAGQ
jgi:general secretion pathway protein D